MDLDNTLYDFASAQEAGCQAAAAYLNRDDLHEMISDLFFAAHGPEERASFTEVLGRHGIDDEEVIDAVFSVYEEIKHRSLIPYPGVIESLALISRAGIPVIAVTNASYRRAIERVSCIGAGDLLASLITPDRCGYAKPDPAIFRHAARALSLPPGDVCMIGDNLINDIEPARKTGIFAIHARYGDRIPSEYTSGITADVTIQTFSSVIPIIFPKLQPGFVPEQNNSDIFK